MKNRKKDTLISYAWSSPSLILIALMVVFPILYTGYHQTSQYADSNLYYDFKRDCTTVN